MSKIDVTVIIPTWNDAYTIRLALRGWAPHVKRILVVDDCSTDDTQEVVHAEIGEQVDWHTFGNITLFKTKQRVGNVEARNLGLEIAKLEGATKLLFVDADSVFNGNVERLKRAVERPHFLDFHNLVGDLEHMQLLSNPEDASKEVPWADVCQLSVDLEHIPDFKWHADGKHAMNSVNSTNSGMYGRSGLLLWHLKGVKPDSRISVREAGWWEDGRANFNHEPRPAIDWIKEQVLHKMDPPHPEMPAWLLEDQRFKLIYQDGQIVGRTDRGNQCSTSRSLLRIGTAA